MLRIALKVLDPRAKEHLPKTATAGSAGVDLKALLHQYHVYVMQFT